MANSLIIEELTGEKRRVELQGRALPSRKVEWIQRQRNTKTNYPGNPVATFQILGTEYMPTTFTGLWRDRYLGENQSFSIVEYMQNLLDSGKELRVAWGNNTRRGILEEFRHGHDDSARSAGDILWTAVFNWTGLDMPQLIFWKSATFNHKNTPEILRGVASALLGISLPASLEGLAEGILAVQDFIGDINHAIGQIEKAIETAQALIELPFELARTIVTQLERIRNAVFNIVSTVASLPALTTAIVDDVGSLFDGTIWNHSVHAAAGDLVVESEKQKNDFEASSVKAETLQVYVTRGEDLRKVALHFYGRQDEWIRIADHNNLRFSDVPAGTKLKIPRIQK